MEKSKYQKYFAGKKITVMGLGLLGRNLKDAKFLAENGADLIVTDLKTEEELKSSVKQLKKYKNIKFSLGGHRLEDFQDRDFILKGAGIPLKNEFIEEAKENKIPIKMSVSWVLDICRQEQVKPIFIGVTGTKGKSTIVAMLESIFKGSDKKFHMAGNIKGLGGLELLEKIEEKDFLIAELDSWQLQGFGDEQISPDIAVFSNFFDDHLNYYPDRQSYFDDKKNIFAWQQEQDYLITLPESVTNFSQYTDVTKISSKVELAFMEDFPTDWDLKIFGRHMIKNAALAKKTAELSNLSSDIIKQGLENFPGMEGRMQFLGEKFGVLFYNDNNSTTPVSTLAGLKALREKHPDQRIFMVGGGTDKGFEYQELVDFIEREIAYALLFEASGTDKIARSFSTNYKTFQKVGYMEDVQKELQALVHSGDVVILSPACSSFGKQFKNEYDRNDQFLELFKEFLL